MIILTILNTIAIIYIFVHKQFSVHKNTTFKDTLLGYGFFFKGRRFFYVPIRNEEKTELNEDVHEMINASKQHRHQQLRAVFSWLKTIAEVEKFKKDYEVVDRKLVNELVTEFKLNNPII